MSKTVLSKEKMRKLVNLIEAEVGKERIVSIFIHGEEEGDIIQWMSNRNGGKSLLVIHNFIDDAANGLHYQTPTDN